MNIGELTVNGVSIIALVFGLVEFFKVAFKLKGQKVTILSAVIGFVVLVAYQLQPLLPPGYSTAFGLVITALFGALSASGFYKFSKKFVPTETNITLSTSDEDFGSG